MYSFKQVAIITAVTTASVSVLSFPGLAEPNGNATQLLPLEARNVTIESNPNIYRSAANDINASPSFGTSDTTDILDVIDVDFLEGILDENGELDLPLGLTVFDAMGATSVGFGGDF